MGGLEVLSEGERFDVGEEEAFWGFAGCGTGGGESEDEEVNVIGEMHVSLDNMQFLVDVRESEGMDVEFI